MWKLAVFPLLASVILPQATAQGGVMSLAFPGFLPSEYVNALKPIGDGQPNDVYQHLAVRGPALTSEEVVIYPHHFGFEYGQDPEHSIYEVHNAKELVAEHAKKHSKHDKHSKNGKHAHHHHNKGGDDDHHHHHEEHNTVEHHDHHEEHNTVEHHHHRQQSAGVSNEGGYAQLAVPQQKFRPRPAFSDQVHRHFG